jgi:hypothetical protein
MVPGTGLEPVWTIHPRDFKSPSLLFHVVSKCFIFGCFREKIRLSCFKVFQSVSDSIDDFREVFEKRFSKIILGKTAFHSCFLKNVGMNAFTLFQGFREGFRPFGI